MADSPVVVGSGGHDAAGFVEFRSPKMVPATASTPGSKYYAGFDARFVDDLIMHLNLSSSRLVIDPWNGSGTTTVVANTRGLAAVGFDINPVLVIVGKSKLLGRDVVESLDALTYEVLARARRDDMESSVYEPLNQWFTVGTSRYLRKLERSIQGLLVQPSGDLDLTISASLDQMSALAASFYVVLFETVRSFLGAYTCSNPTWFKVRPDINNVTLARDRIDSRFRAVERRQRQRLLDRAVSSEVSDGRTSVKLGDSTAIGLEDNMADACITSPPYCTRIDYAILTRPELAVLGVGNNDVMRRLRDHSIGTPTITTVMPQQNKQWGRYVNTLLNEVRTHTSKASKSYYAKNFLQYFESMFRSLSELRRVLKPDAPCALVVQDSYYKDIHIDLARGFTEMANGLDWLCTERIDFPVPHRRANMNPAARRYGIKTSATESLLILRRQGPEPVRRSCTGAEAF
jgi:DNA modification methylase